LEIEKKLKESELKQKDIEAQKKANEIELLNKDREYQSIVRKSLVGGLIFIGIILVLLFMYLWRKSKDNKLLKKKT